MDLLSAHLDSCLLMLLTLVPTYARGRNSSALNFVPEELRSDREERWAGSVSGFAQPVDSLHEENACI